MDRFRGIASLLVLLGVVFLLLRALHLGVPLLYPQVLRGPFSLEGIAEVEAYTAFSPLLPFFRPEALGPRPVLVTASRPPRPRAVVFWQAERFLYLEQERGGRPPPIPANARSWTLRGPAAEGENHWWRQGRTVHAVARRGELWIEVRTDLPPDDARRVVETLRPHRDLL